MLASALLTQGGWIFVVMVSVFLLMAFWRHRPIGIALVFGSIAGTLVSGNGLPIRHLVEGAFTYLDPILVIFTALVFMRVIQENGLLGTLGRLILSKLGNQPVIMLITITLFIMFPAMLTGITTTSVLTTGALMAPVLLAFGIPRVKAGALIALVGVMGMMAPPINLIVMLIGQGVDMPYIGFTGPLAAIAFPIAIFVSFVLAYRYVKNSKPSEIIDRIGSDDEVTPNISLYSPLIIVFSLMILIRLFPSVIPDIGAPFIFVIGSIVGIFTGKKIKPVTATYNAMISGLPVMGLLAGIGMFLQVMTLTGARGVLVVTTLSLPVILTYVGLAVSLPLFGGISAFASSMVFGIPFLLALLGKNEIIVCVAVALLASMGDVLPPSAIEARLGAQVVGEKNFMNIVKTVLPFVVMIIVIALLIIHFANGLSFLI